MFRYKLWLHNSFVEDFPPRFSRSPLAVFFGRQQVGAEFRSSYVLWFLIQLFFFDVTYGIFLHIFGQEIKICFGYTNTVPHTRCKRDTWLMIQSGISGLSDEATAQKACAAIQEKSNPRPKWKCIANDSFHIYHRSLLFCRHQDYLLPRRRQKAKLGLLYSENVAVNRERTSVFPRSLTLKVI